MYLFYHPELLQADENALTGRTVDDRTLFERITESIHAPVDFEETVQMTPIILLLLSVVCAFASVLLPYGER